MKQLGALIVGLVLAAFLITTANAAPATSSVNQNPQGVKNSRKAMQHRLEHGKKMDQVRKQGQAQRRQAQSDK